LGLGTHLVRELGLEHSVDTLGRWLSHHVAALMAEAQNATTADGRKEAASRAVDVILKIWEHRAVLPGKANPLAHYKEALEALREFQRKPILIRTPWSRPSGTRHQRLLEALDDRVSRLRTGLLLLDTVPPKRPKSLPNAVRRLLSEKERELFETLTSYIFKGVNPGEQDPNGTSIPERLRNLIDDIIRQLQEIREQLPGTAPEGPTTPKSLLKRSRGQGAPVARKRKVKARAGSRGGMVRTRVVKRR
jgi:hypothetical protein